MSEQKVHGSDAIVVLVGFYSGEVKALQARLAASEDALVAVSRNYALLAHERQEIAKLLEVPDSADLAEVLRQKRKAVPVARAHAEATSLKCPSCGSTYVSPDTDDGKHFWCAGCETGFTPKP